MSQPTAQHILDMIDQLSDGDRDWLKGRLGERAEEEWRGEAQKARREAKARGIDQDAIDEAIRRHRYGA